ncbi:MAG: FlgD immunoglobulin-like domain containing protein [Bacteroidota bacterium]
MRATHVICSAIVLLFAAAPGRMAFALWPYDPAVNLPVCIATNNQDHAAIVSDGAGGAIITWSDTRGGTESNIYAQHVVAEGGVDPAWPVDGVAICTAANNQVLPVIVSDGAGGAIIAWSDLRYGNYDVFAQRVLASGTVDWYPGGVAVCTASANQGNVTLVTDGVNGAIVIWSDYRALGPNPDAYCEHLLANGQLDSRWPADGLGVCTLPQSQKNPVGVSDGAGGAIIAWQDTRDNPASSIYGEHVLEGGTVDPAWPAAGLAIGSSSLSQTNPTVVPDGAGGAIVAWIDGRNGNQDIYAQHALATGTVDPVWPPEGRAVCAAVGDQSIPVAVTDGRGGVILAWIDFRNGSVPDIYAHHVQAAGVMDSAWPSNGLAVCTAAGSQLASTMVADGAGGAIVSWEDNRSGVYDIYAQHVRGDGTADPAWPADGHPLGTAVGDQLNPVVTSDAAGGAIVAWKDSRTGTGDIYAQRISASGKLGQAEPTITGVRDFPGDQGGKVRITWTASYLDSKLEISAYGIWHRVSQEAALTAEREGARLIRGKASDADARPGLYRASAGLYWEGVGSILARGYSSYTFVAPTFQDSTASANPYSVFMVDAHAVSVAEFWDSNPDSGYSVDNLAPAMPIALIGTYDNGGTHLRWRANNEADLVGYRLYRGASADFVPGSGNLLAAPLDTACTDPELPGYYKLSAVDEHGNESPFAFLAPGNVAKADADAVPRVLTLASPAPNPVREGAVFRFSLPEKQAVILAIFDSRGRRLRVLVHEELPAGEHEVRWDGLDAQGHMAASGIYFVRLDAARALVRRVAILR